MHSLAFNEPLKGLAAEELRFSSVGPHIELGFIDEAREKFVADSAYLDDRPGSPLRFRTDSNLHQVIRIEERNVNAGELRTELDRRVSEIFSGTTFDLSMFPAGPYDVPDEVGDGHPKLVVLAYDGVSLRSSDDEKEETPQPDETRDGVTLRDSDDHVPELIERIYTRRGAEGAGLRKLRNNVVFVVASESRKEGMREKMRRRLALKALVCPERLTELAAHQQEKVRELETQSERDAAMAILNCYRHVFYPSGGQAKSREPQLTHALIEEEVSSVNPSSGQQQIVQLLRTQNKLRLSKDDPNAPDWIRDQTPLVNGQITTVALRDEFRRAPGLPILIGDDTFVRGIQNGVEQGEYVYRHEGLLYGPGDPKAKIMIDQNAEVLTMGHAKEIGIWPRKTRKPPDHPGPGPGGGGGDPPPPGPRQQTEIKADGVFREALTKVWEQARSLRVDSFSSLKIRIFDPEDAFKLLGLVGQIAKATILVAMTGGYETAGGSAFTMDFNGSLEDSRPVKDFLKAQLRPARSNDVSLTVTLKFEQGLSLDGEAPEKLMERLTRYLSGASADVSAMPAAKAER